MTELLNRPIQRPPTSLVKVHNISYSAEYHRQGRAGALHELYLHPAAARRLTICREYLKRLSTTTRQYDLHVFDGFRPYQVQSSLFEEYAAKLRLESGIDAGTARLQARTFVSDPSTVYPHGTGGTVDLTLTINGRLAWMGTGFDDFTPQAHRRWFHEASPQTPEDIIAHHNRTILDEAMHRAGFIGLPDEWWHYEWGTQRWAAEKSSQPLLTHLAELAHH